jgi:membrane protein implicated in regulation of membrane protease activity
MWSDTLVSWYWFGLAAVCFVLEAVRRGKFMVWLGLAATLVGVVASVAHWPWPYQVAALVIFAIAAIPGWRSYERKARTSAG